MMYLFFTVLILSLLEFIQSLSCADNHSGEKKISRWSESVNFHIDCFRVEPRGAAVLDSCGCGEGPPNRPSWTSSTQICLSLRLQDLILI
ncbi:hypothetical protein BY996DRAFT_3403909 [Phakopsora pachyrhizi]|nr:hypothetical protein BY996DRAFT_3403909 [Phakopsora pachyrhizi]